MESRSTPDLDNRKGRAAHYRQIIASGARSADEYINNSIIDSPNSHIGPSFGLDERRTRDLVQEIFLTIEDDRYADSLSRYFRALNNYSGSAYEVLATGLSGSVSPEEVYVPLQAKGQVATSDLLLMSDAIRAAFEASCKQLLIEGLPGSGKSTLIRQIARRCWNDPSSVGLDRSYIALPIRLRSYSQAEGAGNEDRIWNALDRACELHIDGSRPPPGYYAAWTKHVDAPWLLLLDGFDEVSGDHTDEILSWLRRLTQENVAFVVTSRPTYAIPRWFRESVRQFDIQPFTAEQQRQLAEKWLGSRAEDFQNAFARIAQGELGGTPLLLTIAAIVFHTAGALPARRIELYRIFVADLWREAVKRGAREELGPDLADLAPTCLRQIARTMTENHGQGSALDFGGGVETLTPLVAKTISVALNLREPISSIRSARLINFLGTRSGVFRTSAYQSEWLHPTFREFLTAESIGEEVNDGDLSEVLKEFRDPSWRQVVFFLIAILNERGSVTEALQIIRDVEHPFGAAFAAVAITEGANVNKLFKVEVVTELCEDIRAHARGGICERLLLPGDSGAQSRAALAPFMNSGELTAITSALNHDLVRLAYRFGKDSSAAINDLLVLRSLRILVQVAGDTQAPCLVRADAARALRLEGYNEVAFETFAELAAKAAEDPSHSGSFFDLLALSGDAEFFARLINEKIIVGRSLSILLNSLRNRTKLPLLETLAGDARLDSSVRFLAELRTQTDPAYILDLMPTLPNDPETLEPCFEVLVKASDRAGLYKVATGENFMPEMRRRAIGGLASLRAFHELEQIVTTGSANFSTRRRAAEALWKYNSAGSAQLLARFFESWGKHSERGPILARRGAVEYLSGEYDKAIALLDRSFDLRQAQPHERRIRAHALEIRGRQSEALEEYGRILALDPSDAFARCRRASIHWERHQFEAALVDLREVKQYEIPGWFRPYGGDILRECGAFEEANQWLDLAVKEDPSSLLPRSFRAKLAFDQGRFSASVADLQRAIALNPYALSERFQLARILRVAGRYSDAADEFTKLLADYPDDPSVLSERAAVFLRLGLLGDADVCIAALRSQYPEEPFFLHLEGLSHGLRGERGRMLENARSGLSLISCDTTCKISRSNRALFLLAIGDDDGAHAILEVLKNEREYDQLRLYTVPFLDDLYEAMPDRSDIEITRDDLISVLWPKGWELEVELDMKHATLAKIKREPYPFPMYSQLSNIQGLEQDGELAQQIIRSNDDGARSIVLWTLSEPERVFGYCSFKRQSDAEHNLKFCDSINTILARNLAIFVNDFGVRRFLFLEEDLLTRFSEAVASMKPQISCSLVDLPDGATAD